MLLLRRADRVEMALLENGLVLQKEPWIRVWDLTASQTIRYQSQRTSNEAVQRTRQQRGFGTFPEASPIQRHPVSSLRYEGPSTMWLSRTGWTEDPSACQMASTLRFRPETPVPQAGGEP